MLTDTQGKTCFNRCENCIHGYGSDDKEIHVRWCSDRQDYIGKLEDTSDCETFKEVEK